MNGSIESKSGSRELWFDSRLNRLCYAFVIAVSASFILFPFLGKEGHTSFYTGDVPAFNASAVMLKRGQGEELYNLPLQKSTEHEFYPEMGEAFYVFAYPPFMAWLLYPLAFVGPYVAKHIFTAVQGGCLLLAVGLLGRYASGVGLSFIQRLVFLCGFSSIFAGVFGAQNTATSMFLFLGSLTCLEQRSKKYDLAAGALISLWLFKPQFSVPFLVSLFLLKRWHAVLSAGGLCLLWYCIGIATLGMDWPIHWLGAATGFGELNFTINAHNMISLSGTLYAVREIFALPVQTHVLTTVGTLTSILVLGVIFANLGWKVWIKGSSVELVPYWCLLGVLVPCLNPQTLFYDMGIQIISLFVLVSFRSDKEISRWFLLCFLSWTVIFLRWHSLFPLFVPLSLILVVWAFLKMSNGARGLPREG